MSPFDAQSASVQTPPLQAPALRSRIREDGSTLVLAIPPRADLWVGFGTVLIWGVVLLMVVRAWPTGTLSGGGLIARLLNLGLGLLPSGWSMPTILVLFAAITVILLAVAIYAMGRIETATFDAERLVLRTTIAGFTVEEKCYELSNIASLRVASPDDRKSASFLTRTGWDDEGTLAFDYGPDTVVFGACLPAAEARKHARVLREFLGSSDDPTSAQQPEHGQ